MVHPKKTRAGFDERLAVLSSHLAEASELFKDAFVSHGCFEVQRDDIIDALANALCASHGRECATLPTDPEIDQEGLTMEMVYWDPNGT